MNEPLWSDEQIEKVADEHTSGIGGDQVYYYHLFVVTLTAIRDEYEAAIAALQQAPQGVSVPDDVHSLLVELVTERLEDIAITPGYNDMTPDETQKALAWLKAQRPDAGQEDGGQ